ncbi:MAG: hypothetical protein U1F51_01905 [Burkholderiales bacterium]
MSTIVARIAVISAWLVPFALLGAIIGAETDWGREIRRPPPPEAPVAPAPVATSILPGSSLVGGLDTLSATVERPLFNATRRPAPAAVAEAPKPTIQRGQFALTGTMITGDVAIAYLKDATGTGKARSVKRGDTVNGMLVAEVGNDRVRLALGDETEDLALMVAKGPKTTAPAGAAPAGTTPAASAPGAPAQGGAVATGAGTGTGRGGRVRGAVAQAGAPGTDGAENLRAARRAARAAEGQQRGEAPSASDAMARRFNAAPRNSNP